MRVHLSFSSPFPCFSFASAAADTDLESVVGDKNDGVEVLDGAFGDTGAEVDFCIIFGLFFFNFGLSMSISNSECSVRIGPGVIYPTANISSSMVNVIYLR